MTADEIKEMLNNIGSYYYKLNDEIHTIEKSEMGGVVLNMLKS